MQRTPSPLLVALTLALLAGCSSPASSTGSVQFAVSIPQALSASDVTRVKVTVSASDMSSVGIDLARSNGAWGGVLGNLPVGTNRLFLAQAYDSSGALRFQGQASGVSIAANQTTAVALTLQEFSPPAAYGNESPVIDSFVSSSTSVQKGGALSLTTSVHDPNPGDTLTLAWTSSGGTFSAPTAANTSWTAPASPGVQTLTLTVTDSRGAAVSLSLAVNVVSSASTGSAALDLSFNLWPTVSKVSSSLNRLDVGQSTSVSALASDADGDSLSYLWTASCPGSWTNATSSSASFSPSSIPAGTCNNCLLSVAVQDGHGGQTTGSLSLCVASASTTRFAPSFTNSYQSAASVSPGQTVSFDVTALDPQSSSLTFAWTANTGSLATAQNTATTSHVVWTAPSSTPPGVTPTVTATATNAYGLSGSQAFSISGLPTTTYPPGALSSGGLTWTKPEATTQSWGDGHAYCTNTAIAGQTGWRMPTAGEISALWGDKGSSGFLAAQGWPLDWIWTMSPSYGGHYVKRMSNGDGSWGDATNKEFVTCVRGTGEFPATLSNAGLTWMRPDATARAYAAAQTYCSSATLSGRTGWRLPTDSELKALHTAKGSEVLAGAGWTLDWLWTTTPYSSGHIVVRDAGVTSFSGGVETVPMTCVYPGIL